MNPRLFKSFLTAVGILGGGTVLGLLIASMPPAWMLATLVAGLVAFLTYMFYTGVD